MIQADHTLTFVLQTTYPQATDSNMDDINCRRRVSYRRKSSAGQRHNHVLVGVTIYGFIDRMESRESVLSI